MNAVKSCCLREARKFLKRPRDVATCDECGSLLLAHGNELDFQNTIEELMRHGVAFESAPSDLTGGLAIVAKVRKPS